MAFQSANGLVERGQERWWEAYWANNRADDTIRNKLVEANLGLVKKTYNRIINQTLSSELEQDCMQEGAIGVHIAIKKFEPERRKRFSTYADYWIVHEIKRYLINCGTTIRVPAHVHEVGSKAAKARLEFIKEFGRPPTNDRELAKYTSISEETLLRTRNSLGVTILSLDQPAPGKENSRTDIFLGEIIPDNTALLAIDSIIDGCYEENTLGEAFKRFGPEGTSSEEFQQALAKLPPRSRAMLSLCAGGMSTKDIALSFGLDHPKMLRTMKDAILDMRRLLSICPMSRISLANLTGE